MSNKFEDKAIKRIAEVYDELTESGKEKVLDLIKYDGILKAAADIAKTKTVHFGDLYSEAIERQKTFFTFEGMATGIQYIDDATMGLRGGETTIIAGPSNLGKTMFALNVLTRAVINNNGVKALIISMEMPAIDIVSRMYNMAHHDEHEPLMENVIVQTDLDVNTRHIAVMIKKHKPDIVLIDHIQFLANQEKAPSEYERTNLAVKRVQRLAVTNNIPILIISHVAKSRSGKNGKASAQDLKGSSSIEQDSDIVIILNRDEEQRQNGHLSVDLVKQRKKGSKLYYKPCVIKFDGIKLANDYYIEDEQPQVVHKEVKDIFWR